MQQTILVVEDNAVTLASLSFFLRERGYFVVQATDGAQALKLLQGGLKFDAVLSDISLPGIDGYHILQHVRSSSPNTPVILMSGNFTLGCPSIPEGGADAYVLKPLNLENLLQKISTALAERAARVAASSVRSRLGRPKPVM